MACPRIAWTPGLAATTKVSPNAAPLPRSHAPPHHPAPLHPPPAPASLTTTPALIVGLNTDTQCLPRPSAGLLFSIAPNLLAYLLAYALLGTYVTTAGFGRRLMHLTYALLQREADLRFALVRVRENAGLCAQEFDIMHLMEAELRS